MRHARFVWGWRGGALLAGVLVVLAGCASLKGSSGAPITDINAIAGKWTGTITPSTPGFGDRFDLTITPDSKMTASWGSNTAWGTVTLRDGQATYEMEPPVLEGTIRLHRDGDRRTLVLNDRWATFTAQLTPQP